MQSNDLLFSFNRAIDFLATYSLVSNPANPSNTELFDAAYQRVATSVRKLCKTDVYGLGEWLEQRVYIGDETPIALAREWDANPYR